MKKSGIITLALSAALASPSFAASTASASLSDFTVTLIDLDPNDAFAPVITWRVAPDAPGGSAISGAASTLDPAQSRSFSAFGPSPFSPLRGVANSPVASSMARIAAGPGGQVSGGSALAQGRAGAIPGTPVPQDGYSYFAQALPVNSTDFILSPHTQVIFSARGSALAATTVGAVARNGFLSAESASARVEMRVAGPGPGGEGDQQDLALVAADAGFRQTRVFDPSTGQFTTVFSPESFADNRRLSVSFTNNLGAELVGGLSLNIFASGFSSVPAVPEPASYAAMIAGLLLLGGIARGRQRTAA